MKYVIVYWSRYGNGKRIVEKLAKILKKKGEVDILKTDDTDPKAMPKADLYVFSAPTEAFRVQKSMRTFMKNLEGMENKKYAIINTHAMDRNWLRSMEKMLAKKKMIKVAGVDFKIGKKPETGNALMEGWETKLEEFAKKL